LTATLEGYLREEDAVFRYGGDEFLVLMPSTSPEEAFARMEALRAGVAATRLMASGLPLESLTVSIGVAGSADHAVAGTPAEATARVLLKAAAAAMYRAKEAGGDRVEVAGPSDLTQATDR
jgi:diguanylate cyclase (GGDEF)-like protein